MSSPPLPSGYQLDENAGAPPLPAGYQLDTAAAGPSLGDRLTAGYDPGAAAFDEKHPVLGKGARFLSSLGGTVLGMPAAAYHAIADPATEEEKAKYAEFEKEHGEAPGTETSGVKRLGLAAERISGAGSVEQGIKDYANPTTRPTLGQAASVLPEALGQGAGTVVGAELGGRALGTVARGVPAVKGAVSDALAKDLPSQTSAAHSNFAKAIPATKSAPYTPEDLQAARPYLEDEHATAPIKTVADVKDAADSAIGRIEDNIRNHIRANPTDQIANKPLDAVKSALAPTESLRQGFLQDGLKELAPYNLDEPLTVQKADQLRRQFNAENRAFEAKNNYDKADARATDPAYAAREAAAQALRSGVYDKLEERGVPGIQQIRQDEGSVIAVRDAAQNQIFNGEKAVGGTGSNSIAGKMGKSAVQLATTGGGAAIGGALGGGVGAVTGSVLGAGAGEAINRVAFPGNLTRDALVERSFQTPVTEGATLPEVPAKPAIRGLLNAPKTELPAAGFTEPKGEPVGTPIGSKGPESSFEASPVSGQGPSGRFQKYYSSGTGPQIQGTKMGQLSRIGGETWMWNGEKWTRAGAGGEGTFKLFSEGEQSRPFVAPESSTTYGSQNKFVTTEDADLARKNLQSKMFRQSAGLDPTMMADAAKLGAYHLEAGIREFGAWSDKMVGELGEKIRPHLQDLWEQVHGGDSPDAPTFYSKAAQVADAKVMGSAPGDQILSTLKNAGVKDDEIRWMGLDDYLKGKPKVQKADLQNFINDNQIQLEESTRSNQAAEIAAQRSKTYAEQNRMWEKLKYDTEGGPTIGRWLRSSDEDKAAYVKEGVVSPAQLAKFEHFDELGRQIADLDMQRIKVQEKPTKFEQYTLPGEKENYRELLMKLPEKTVDSKALARELDLASELRATARRRYNENPSDDSELNAAQDRWQRAHDAYNAYQGSNLNFRSSHFDEPNILAHVRFDDRVDAGGKKTLFLEEVQSDWHQQGKKQGYQTTPQDIIQSIKDRFRITNNEWNNLSQAAQQGYIEQMSKNDAVPNAPFKSDWHELAMKRMLRYAAEKGYDQIAWTTGEQQAERYDLSKQVSKVIYDPNLQNLRAVDHSGQEVINKDNVKSEDLPSYIGKDAAQKLLASELRKGTGTYKIEGQDLKVGGEWAKALYDRAIPNFLNKYAKKWGARVGETEMQVERNPNTPGDPEPERDDFEDDDHGEERYLNAHDNWEDRTKATLNNKVHSLEVTPAMKKSVLKEGQPISKLEAPIRAPQEVAA